MNVYLNKISGIDDAIISMFISKRTWTRELELDIIETCNRVFERNGRFDPDIPVSDYEKVDKWLSSLFKFGKRHITMLRFIDFSITVEGLHRGGQDDWDSHAARFNNRIIRSSTRLSTFDYEMSDYYKDMIIPTDQALSNILSIGIPGEIEVDGVKYVKTINGYIREDVKDNKDVKRGLYMLSIPSTFTFKVNLTEFAHVYKERGSHGTANPEVKECAEEILAQIHDFIPWIDRDLLMEIMN